MTSPDHDNVVSFVPQNKRPSSFTIANTLCSACGNAIRDTGVFKMSGDCASFCSPDCARLDGWPWIDLDIGGNAI